MTQIFKQLSAVSLETLAGGSITANNGIFPSPVVDLSKYNEAVLFVNISAMGASDVLQLSKIEFANSASFGANDNIKSFEVNQPYPFGDNTFFRVGSGEYIFYPKEDIKVDSIISAVITKSDFDSNKAFAKGKNRVIGLQLNNYPLGKFCRFTFTGTSTDGTVAITITSLVLVCQGNDY